MPRKPRYEKLVLKIELNPHVQEAIEVLERLRCNPLTAYPAKPGTYFRTLFTEALFAVADLAEEAGAVPWQPRFDVDRRPGVNCYGQPVSHCDCRWHDRLARADAIEKVLEMAAKAAEAGE